ncbi:MAG: hypothetical protein R3B70_07305 [Polyangiaceae bacterium]
MLDPSSADALDLTGGVSVGGILIGAEPYLAVSPNAAASWHFGRLALAVHDHLNILPAINRLGIGVYNQTALTIGYSWSTGDASIGPSLSFYSVPACAGDVCGRVTGLGPGGHAQVNVYFGEHLGISTRANVDWLGGPGTTLPSSIAAMVFAGPIVRWGPH